MHLAWITRAAAASAAVALAFAGAHAAIGEDKPAPTPLAETATVPAPPEPPDGVRDTTAAPFKVATAGSTDGCGGGARRFTNPVLPYRLCVPPGWGFTDFTTRDPLTELDSTTLDALHLISPAAFPWQPGRLPFDAIRNDGVVDIELTILERGTRAANECEPMTPVSLDALTVRVCEQRYDVFGLPATVGPITATKVIVPLVTTPEQTHPLFDPAGARLLVIVRSATTNVEGAKAAWRIIESIRAL